MEKSIELTPIDIRLFDIIKQYIDAGEYSPASIFYSHSLKLYIRSDMPYLLHFYTQTSD